MDQLKRLLGSLTWLQKLAIVAAALAAGGAIWGVGHWQREKDFQPLFTGLAPEDAGALVQKLKESGVEYRLGSGGGAVLVPSARVAETRLTMASAGLPKSGRIGFELFDKTNFGVTEFAEQVNYRRALEGELERSILSLNEVERVRVHLTFPKDSLYLESRQPGKASVMVGLRAGARLGPERVAALQNLTASAVEGLQAESVAVVDMRGALLSRPRRSGEEAAATPDAALEFRQQIEADLVRKVNLTLEPLLGAGRFRAGATVECDFSSGEQSEEIFDSTRAAMTSSQKTEDVSGPGLAAAGVPGAAANLPRAAAAPATSDATRAGVARTTENVAYQPSRTVRRMKIPQGGVKRISLAVLVDHQIAWRGQGAKLQRIVQPPAPETLKSIRDLVSAATGLVAERDQLIVEALPFESTRGDELPPPAAPASNGKPGKAPVWAVEPRLVILGGAVLIVLLIVALWVAKKGRRRPAPRAASAPELGPGAAPPEIAGAAAQPGVAGTAAKQIEARLAEQVALQDKRDAEALSRLKVPNSMTKKSELLTKHLQESVKKDPLVSAQILRSWLTEQER